MSYLWTFQNFSIICKTTPQMIWSCCFLDTDVINHFLTINFIVNLIANLLLRLCIKRNIFLLKCVNEIWFSIGIQFTKNWHLENVILVSLL